MADISDKELTLTSSYNYSRLDKIYKSEGDPTLCNELNQKLSEYEGINDFCMKLTRALSKLEDLLFSGPFNMDRCTIINYWMHDKLFNAIIKSDDLEKNSYVLSEIFNIWGRISSHSVCDMYPHLNIKNNFNEVKKLYDFATDYENIRLHLTNKKHVCTKRFQAYIEDILQLYEKAKSKRDSSDVAYTKVLNYFEKVYTSKKLSDVTCIEVIDVTTTARTNLQNLSSGEVRGPEQAGGESHKGEFQEQSESGPSHHYPEAHMNYPSHFPSNIVMGVVFSLSGVFLIFFILKKFSPFSTWLRSPLRGKNIIENNFEEEETNKCLENIYEHVDKYYEDGKHLIGYHTFSNT
ncbi:PIR protein [Plasmodium ovale]|uniref:PIR protein n=1 Tax=Plasmodium ovale TaxID=36330 RepID=A0A1C3KGU7_PLAOA|nr:PIR protein [Plasmodium ovale]